MGSLADSAAEALVPRIAPQRAPHSSVSQPSWPTDDDDHAAQHTRKARAPFDPAGKSRPKVMDLPREELPLPTAKGEHRGKPVRLLSSTARGVFGILCEHANKDKAVWPQWVDRSHPGWLAWPSVLTIAAMSGYTDRAVQEALTELEQANALECIYRSKGGAPRKTNGRWEPAKTSAYLITPNQVHRSQAAAAGAEPRTEFSTTPNQKSENPERRSPQNPEPGSPDVFNHHHQKENIKDLKGISTPPDRTPSLFPVSDDDDAPKKRALIHYPEEEFVQRLRERAWRGGPIGDPYSIVKTVADGLKYDQPAWREFLEFEVDQTTPEKIKTPAAHYRALVTKFHASRAHRHVAERRQELEARTAQRAGAAAPVCTLNNPQCNGRGELYGHEGEPLGVCNCDAGRQISPDVKNLLLALSREHKATRRA